MQLRAGIDSEALTWRIRHSVSLSRHCARWLRCTLRPEHQQVSLACHPRPAGAAHRQERGARPGAHTHELDQLHAFVQMNVALAPCVRRGWRSKYPVFLAYHGHGSMDRCLLQAAHTLQRKSTPTAATEVRHQCLSDARIQVKVDHHQRRYEASEVIQETAAALRRIHRAASRWLEHPEWQMAQAADRSLACARIHGPIHHPAHRFRVTARWHPPDHGATDDTRMNCAPRYAIQYQPQRLRHSRPYQASNRPYACRA